MFLDLELFSEGVIHLGLRPRWITLSSIYRILHIVRKPNSIIADYYFKHGENVKCVSHIRISLCFAFMIHPRILFASARASAYANLIVLCLAVHVNSCRKIASVNLLNLNNSIHILHTVLHTYLVLLIRRICLTVTIFSLAACPLF